MTQIDIHYKQFHSFKKKYPDAVLLFRYEDTYCSFEQDAEVLNKVLDCPLLDWEGIKAAGFPHYALDTYLPKLIRAGKRVAICDLLDAPKPKEIVTPYGYQEPKPQQLTLF